MVQSLPLFPEARFGNRRSKLRAVEAVSGVARRLWPSKTAVNLASRCDVGQRAAELWMEGRNDISAEALVALLRSDAGYDLLQELMQGASTRWWREFERGVRIQDIEQKIEFQRRALSALKVDMTR